MRKDEVQTGSNIIEMEALGLHCSVLVLIIDKVKFLAEEEGKCVFSGLPDAAQH